MAHGCLSRAVCWLMAALGLAVAGSFGLANAARALPAATARIVTLGKPAPAFTLTDVRSGKPLSLASIRKGKKATVVMFIATRCPVSNAYDQRMIDLAKNYGKRGVAFVGINANQTEPAPECASHAAQHAFPFPVLKDRNSAIADAYGAMVTPETYVVDAHGDVLYHGRIDDSQDPSMIQSHDLANALDQVLAGKPVTHPQLRAFGCTIKRGTGI